MYNLRDGMQMISRLEGLTARLARLSDTPALDAQVLLAHILDKSRAWVLAHPEAKLTSGQQAALGSAVRRLEGGEALPYVLGGWEFFGLEFILTPDVLIPRPETELLVEAALRWLRTHPDRRCAADIGTGSGCIAVSLAVNVPDLHMIATDISRTAVNVARRNAEKFDVTGRMDFFCCDLLPEDMQPLDLVAANLPYIPSKTLRRLRVHGREPVLALDGGADGLDIIRRLMAGAPCCLAPGGLLLVEIEASQGAKVLSLACDAFAEAEIHLRQDLSGRDRLVEVQL